MSEPRTALRNLVHAVADRAIRHDAKAPLGNVSAFTDDIRDSLAADKDSIRRVSNGSAAVKVLEEIPKRLRAIEIVLLGLQHDLDTRGDFTGADARDTLLKVIEDECKPLEIEARQLEGYLAGSDDEIMDHCRIVAKHATAAKTRLQSIVEFFRGDFGIASRSEVDVRHEAEGVARTLVSDGRKFRRMFSFEGGAYAHASRTLIQGIFQNVYQNSLRYGGKPERLRIMTRFQEGSFSKLSVSLPSNMERPLIEGPWVRIDFENNGPPIDAQNLDALFKLGKRFRVAGAEEEVGHGIGMSICFVAATLHRGTILALPSDRGAHFTLLIPKDTPQGYTDKQLQLFARSRQII